jgi:hypothetical protein
VSSPLLAALVATALPFLQYRGTLDLADRTEVRGGNFGFSNDPSLHLETVPSATLVISGRRSGLTLGYAPRLGLTDIETGWNSYYLHNGVAGVAGQWRDLRLTLDEAASYGTLNLSTPQLPGAGTVATARLVPLLTQQVLYEASTTTLAGSIVPARRWSLRVALSYSVSGGANIEARRVLRLFRGPRAEAVLDYAAGRLDHFLTTVSAEHQSISPSDQVYAIIQGTEGLSHRLSRAAELQLGGGAVWVYAKLPVSSINLPLELVGPRGLRVPIVSLPTDTIALYDGAIRTSRTVYPAAQAQLLLQIPYRDRVEARIQARLEPAINRGNGQLFQQVGGLATVRAISHPWRVGIDANMAQSLEGGANYVTYFSTQFALGYEVTRHVLVDWGGQLGWQKIGVGGQPTTVQLAFVAVTLRHPTLRF